LDHQPRGLGLVDVIMSVGIPTRSLSYHLSLVLAHWRRKIRMKTMILLVILIHFAKKIWKYFLILSWVYKKAISWWQHFLFCIAYANPTPIYNPVIAIKRGILVWLYILYCTVYSILYNIVPHCSKSEVNNFRRFNAVCYLLSKGKLDWSDAMLSCLVSKLGIFGAFSQ
jgi:hypothetical protein